jgi:hypothetical protein
VLYLGHIISGQGVSVNPEKVEVVKSIPLPKNQHDVRAFLGLTNYYRKHVRNYANIASPLNKLLSKDVPFKWTEDCDKAFQLVKDMLTSVPILAFPNMTKPFILTCDASGSAIGYILSKKGDEGLEHVIAYGGRALKSTEKHYPITELECMSIIEGVNQFHVYLANQHLKFFTDHKAIVWLRNFKHTNNRLHRWALRLQEYDFEIIYKEGSNNTAADCLSRLALSLFPSPVVQLEDTYLQLNNR